MNQLELTLERPERPWNDELTAWEAKMKRARAEAAADEEYFQQSKRLAETWAVKIRQAFLNGQPCPIRVTGVEGVRPLDALYYQSILEWAFQLACVPKACLPEDPQLSTT